MRFSSAMVNSTECKNGWVACFAIAVIWLSAGQIESAEDTAQHPPGAASTGWPPGSASKSVKHPLEEAIEFARARQAALQPVDDYTATFSKTELINRRVINQTMDLKFRRKPFSVYLRRHSRLQPMGEAIFVAGMSDDKVVLHESGLKALITMTLKPDDRRLMAENRYPITDIGMEKMLDSVLAIWDREKQIDPANLEVKFISSAMVGLAECEEIKVTQGQRLAGLKFHVTRLSFEKKTGFPVQVEQYDWPEESDEKPPLVERYTYSDIKATCGLTDADFDPGNSAYRFKIVADR